MIAGIKNHIDTNIRYDQTRGAWENFLKELMLEFIEDDKIKQEEAVWLYTCGMSAFSTEMEGLGYLTPDMYLHFPKKREILLPMDDITMLIMALPTYQIFKDKPDNYYLDTYVHLAQWLYDCPAYRVKDPSFSMAADLLTDGHGIQICLINPAHWIAPVDYDNVNDLIRFHDSWGGRPGLQHVGIHEPLYRIEWSNVVPAMAVYPKKE